MFSNIKEAIEILKDWNEEMNKHSHKHDHCEHGNVKYCRQCNLVHCLDCGFEWRNYTGWYYYPTPYYTTTTDVYSTTYTDATGDLKLTTSNLSERHNH